MTLKPWVDKGDLQKVEVTRESLSNLLSLIDRDIADAGIASVSPDRRFAIAYSAALNLASYVIRKRGYRVTGKVGHHRITFQVAGEVLGKKAREHLDYFDVCRRKRNRLDYDLAGVATDKEVSELIEKVIEFRSLSGIP